MKRIIAKYTFLTLFTILMAQGGQLYAQATMPEVLENGTLLEQKDYLENKMNNYNGYRAVREDIFLKILNRIIHLHWLSHLL